MYGSGDIERCAWGCDTYNLSEMRIFENVLVFHTAAILSYHNHQSYVTFIIIVYGRIKNSAKTNSSGQHKGNLNCCLSSIKILRIGTITNFIGSKFKPYVSLMVSRTVSRTQVTRQRSSLLPLQRVPHGFYVFSFHG